MPFDNNPTGKLNTKISPLIDGQLPDFIQSDHPVFSRFLKHYYQYLEAGELRLTVNIDNLLLELTAASNVLDVDGNKIVLESGSGSDGKFTAGETITGGTSKATATVLVDDLGASTSRLFITSQQRFITGETVTGGTSGASGVVTRYRANPVQTIQQLLDYADVDNTIYDFLDNFRDEFMNAIPLTLADGISKRNLIKNIRELYRAKGTSEGHKIFMRMLLGETADVTYPNQYMMKASDGKWASKTIMRVAPLTNVAVSEAVGGTIIGGSSGEKAVVASATAFSEGGAAIVEFELNKSSPSDTFAFTDGETVTTTAKDSDVSMTFTVKRIVDVPVITNSSALYTVDQDIEFDTNTSIGNGLATARINNINTGQVNGIVVDDVGSKYEVGDTLTFTTSDSNTKSAEGFVSIIDGSFLLEGTDKASTNENDYILTEVGSRTHIDYFEVALENETGNLLLNGTDASSTHAGHTLSMEPSIQQESNDTYNTDTDRFQIEEGTDYSGGIYRVFVKDGGGGYVTIPTVTITSTTGTSGALLATTDNIGSVGEVRMTNQGFNYSAVPAMAFQANFTLKDVSGTFAAKNTLTTHTGTVKGWDSTNNILTTTFEDVVRKTLETGDSEGFLLEDGSRVGSDVVVRTVGINNSLEQENEIVDADGNNIVLNNEDTLDGYIIIESGNGFPAGSALVLESPNDSFIPPLQLEYSSRDGTNVGDGIANEDGTGDVLLNETSFSLGDNTNERQHPRFLIEEAQLIAARSSGAGARLITDHHFDEEAESTILLDGTDSSQTDIGSLLLNENDGDNNTIRLEGTDLDFIRILLNGTDSASTSEVGFIHLETGTAASGVILNEDSGTSVENVSAKLLHDIETASGVISLDGTDSDSTNAGDDIVNEDAIDFFANATATNPYPTTITDSGGATGTIVKANIAKGTSAIATTTETAKSYGVNIESLIGEDLNRIQDSYYYQQFSYEVETGFGTATYLDQLKKAVHPAGWAVFGKVVVQSSVSVAITDAGSSLGGGYYSGLGVAAPEDKFSPILASTFEILFSESTQRRLASVDIVDGAFEEHIVLEESEDIKVEGDSIILDGTDSSSTNAGSYALEEIPLFHFDDFVGIHLEDGTDTGAAGNGVITLNGTDSSSSNANDRIISEKSVVVTANIVMNSSEDSDHVARTDSGDDILLDGTDSDSTNAGDSMELEDASSGIVLTKLGLQGNQVLNTILNEDGGSQQLETSFKGGGPNHDVSLVSFVTTKIHIPQSTPRHLSTGLVTLARNPFHNPVAKFELEKGTANPSGYLLVDADNFQQSLTTTTGHGADETIRGEYAIDAGENFILEDATDPNNDASFTFENIGNYSNHTIVSEFDIIILEQATTGWIGTSADKIILNATDSDYSNAGENIVAEVSENAGDTLVLNGVDSSSTSAGFKILGESVVQYDSFNLSDIVRPSLLVLDSHIDDGLGPTGGSTPVKQTAIILEESNESGFFMQENETTASGSHGDNILLESRTGFGTNNKLELESDRVIVEDKINDGTIPFQNYLNSTLEPIARSADILISEYGAIDLEDESDGAILLNGTDGSSTDAGGRFRFELATDDNITINYPNV